MSIPTRMIASHPKTRYGVLLMIALGLVFTGCSDEDTFSPEPISVPYYQWPDTADKLMENFHHAYTEMQVGEYRVILHEDFEFIFIDNMVIWSRDDDLQSTENMFSGNPGQNPDGSFRSGVQSISVNSFIRQTSWQMIAADAEEFPGAERALYEVIIIFYLAPGTDGTENTISIACDQEFYVKTEDVDTGDGSTRTRYLLIGQRDVGSWPKSADETTWGQIKSLFGDRSETRVDNHRGFSYAVA